MALQSKRFLEDFGTQVHCLWQNLDRPILLLTEVGLAPIGVLRARDSSKSSTPSLSHPRIYLQNRRPESAPTTQGQKTACTVRRRAIVYQTRAIKAFEELASCDRKPCSETRQKDPFSRFPPKSFYHLAMSDLRPLESLQALHGELLAVCQHRFEGLQALEVLLEENKKAFRQFLDKKSRNQQSRTSVGTRGLSRSGKCWERFGWFLLTLEVADKITLGEVDDAEEYQINNEFVDDTLRVADELDLDELEAARLLLDASAEGDPEAWGRPLWECGMLRFHQERRFLLDCMRLLIEIAADEDIEDNLLDVFGGIVEHQVFGVAEPGAKAGEVSSRDVKMVPKCTQAMLAVRQGLQSHVERMTAKSMLQQASLLTKVGEQQEVYEFVRISMVEQHELLAVILCSAIEKRHAEVKDFKEFLAGLKKADRYDHILGKLFCFLRSGKGLMVLDSSYVSRLGDVHHRLWVVGRNWGHSGVARPE
jgi:hypothetical protein